MADPTGIIPGLTSEDAQATSFAQLEFDEPANTLEPFDYVYLLAHVPPGKQLVEPFKSSDRGSMQSLGIVNLERVQAGLELNAQNLSLQLNYYPFGTPIIYFFGNSTPINQSKLRSGIVAPLGKYDGEEVYIFNVVYQVQFHRIRHRPNHPALISEADGGILWEDYKGTGALSNWPVSYQVGYK